MAQFLAIFGSPYMLLGIGVCLFLNVLYDNREWLRSKLPAMPSFKRITAAGSDEYKDTLLSIRHKVSEMPSGAERINALNLCDQIDKVAADVLGGK